jgi:3-ketosteroid 9alpha-monooxygenase subunit B
MSVSAPNHGFHPIRVSRVIAETADAVSLVLDVPPELRETFSYRSGQFVTFRFTIDGRHQLRSYSMSSAPETDIDLQVTVKRVPGGVVSSWITKTLVAGDIVETTRPAGVFTLNPGQGDIVAVAGGSGITPVFALLKSALATTSRRVRLLYANRENGGVIFREQLDTLAERHRGRLDVVHHFDSEQGFVNSSQLLPYATLAPDTEFYLCGPGPFMDLVTMTLTEHGIDAGRIHIERFTPSAPTLPAAPITEGEPEAKRITITLAGNTQTALHREGTTVLQTARSMGMAPPFSCEAGDCATCMAKVVEGAADMFVNNALLEDEVTEGWILTCQAVPSTPTLRVVYEDS